MLEERSAEISPFLRHAMFYPGTFQTLMTSPVVDAKKLPVDQSFDQRALVRP